MAMDGLTKMWVSFIGIGLMAMAAVIITIARTKTRGWIRIVLSVVAFFMLVIGFIYGMVAVF
jgi:hypothetical protein